MSGDAVIHYSAPWSLAGREIVDAQGRRVAADVSDEDAGRLIAAAPALWALCQEMQVWLRPETLKEPDRTFFWKLVEVLRKVEGKPALFEEGTL